MQTMTSGSKWNAVAAFLAGLLAGSAALHAQNSLPQLWPTFNPPSTIVNVGLAGQSGDDFMAITTFQGAYNQNQLPTRLYVNTPADANYWLTHAVPSSITVTNLSYNSDDADGALKALLGTYGPQGSGTVTKYVLCDPVNAPESCNMATTLAGINDAMVINSDNLTLIQSYGLTQAADLTTYSNPTGSEIAWIGSNSSLVGSTTYNMINNPSGSGGTTGWSDNAGTLATGTGTGSCAGQGSTLEWTRTSGTGNAWAFFEPSIPDSRRNTTPYIFSVQVCVASGSAVFLDVWAGAGDIQSTSVAAGAGWQTLQLAVPLPYSNLTGNTTIKLQVRTAGSSTQVFFHNAAAIDNRTAIDMYQYQNYLTKSCCRGSILAQDFPTNGNLRDYLVAAKIFTFELTQDYADEKPLYTDIVDYMWDVYPVLGYIDDEGNDVPFLSSLGDFLNASDDYNNGSVWASMPQPSSLTQGTPAAVTRTNGTVYVAFAGSDGDNWSILQHQMVQHWTHGQYLGAVPFAWTMSPGLINAAPGIIGNWYAFRPASQEIIAGPGGVGYTNGMGTTSTPCPGNLPYSDDTSCMAGVTDLFMQAEDMSTVQTFDSTSNQSSTTTFASDISGDTYKVPHVLWVRPITETTYGSLPTVLDGQVAAMWYQGNAQSAAAALVSYVNSNWSSSAPLYIEAMQDDLTLSADDTLYIAQYLQNNISHPVVFLTPAELALTEHASGSQATNAQAVAGSTLTSAYPDNMIYNADGQEPGAGLSSTAWALDSGGNGQSLIIDSKYNGTGCSQLNMPSGKNANVYAWEYLGHVPATGRYFRFTATVAGSGTALFTIYDGSANHTMTLPLTSTWQTMEMVIQMQSTTTGQIQVGLQSSSDAGTLYFNASASTQPGWFYTAPTSGVTPPSFGGATYNNGYFGAQALSFSVPGGQSGTQWMNFYPSGLLAGATYNASVDVAGTGQAYVNFYDGSANHSSTTVTLGSQWQTVTVSGIVASSGTPVFDLSVPTSSSAQTAYFRNASLVKAGSGGTADFCAGLESGPTQLNCPAGGQTPLTWSNTPDNVSPGGGVSAVSSPLAAASATITHTGGNAIQYGGTASGGSATHAYLEAFSNGTTLTSTSRLSYWIYPMTPMGSESGASSMTGLNSTCVALDIIFTDGTALRNITTVTDQFGNPINPTYQCNHLQPDQWNYVTANLSGVSGKTVSRIDIGYDQPGASGNYGGYVDDITLSH